MMVIALTLLLVALVFVLYRDRGFWFPETQQTEEMQPTDTPTAGAQSPATVVRSSPPAAYKSKPRAAPPTQSRLENSAPAAQPPSGMAAVSRTVLPPLEVEVVANNVHRSVRPATNSVHVDLEPGSSNQAQPDSSVKGTSDTAATITTRAAERVEMSADMAQAVSYQVKPGYPLLARQMKVQGSVILQALIGKDGIIEDLRVVSGPPILANAAQEAVKKWHFKPHYEGAASVETQARITVNFTISTN